MFSSQTTCRMFLMHLAIAEIDEKMWSLKPVDEEHIVEISLFFWWFKYGDADALLVRPLCPELSHAPGRRGPHTGGSEDPRWAALSDWGFVLTSYYHVSVAPSYQSTVYVRTWKLHMRNMACFSPPLSQEQGHELARGNVFYCQQQ